jgi:hypothetical protein
VRVYLQGTEAVEIDPPEWLAELAFEEAANEGARQLEAHMRAAVAKRGLQ